MGARAAGRRHDDIDKALLDRMNAAEPTIRDQAEYLPRITQMCANFRVEI
jgi:hypothetical protein